MRRSDDHEEGVDAILKSSSSVKTLSQHGLRDEHVAHREHAQPSQLFWGVEDYRREARRHLRVEADLDARLDLVLALDLRAACSWRGSTRSCDREDAIDGH